MCACAYARAWVSHVQRLFKKVIIKWSTVQHNRQNNVYRNISHPYSARRKTTKQKENKKTQSKQKIQHISRHAEHAQIKMKPIKTTKKHHKNTPKKTTTNKETTPTSQMTPRPPMETGWEGAVSKGQRCLSRGRWPDVEIDGESIPQEKRRGADPPSDQWL